VASVHGHAGFQQGLLPQTSQWLDQGLLSARSAKATREPMTAQDGTRRLQWTHGKGRLGFHANARVRKYLTGRLTGLCVIANGAVPVKHQRRPLTGPVIPMGRLQGRPRGGLQAPAG
jgi:hypothetical protein